MSRRGDIEFWLLMSLSSAALGLGFDQSVHAAVPRTPEQEAVWLLPQLKPVPDETWVQVAGGRISQKYEIVSGDTLWSISQRLFGDARYWPKVWALNNDTITNPHLIRPGNSIQFSPGSGAALPSVKITTDSGPSAEQDKKDASLIASSADSALVSGLPQPSGDAIGPTVIDIDNDQPRSQEWRKLPRQPWEFQGGAAIDPVHVDRTGFDNRSRVVFKAGQGMELPYLATSDRVEGVGEITGGRMASKVLSIGYTVFVEPKDHLQVGEIYTVIGGANQLRDADDHVLGFLYMVNGRVKINGVKDGQFVGEVTAMNNAIERGNILIPFEPMIKDTPPVAGASPVEGHLLVDHIFSTYATSQFKTILIDRGRDDGVRDGMVFRAYQKTDPETGKQITDSDFLSLSDIQVVKASDRISVGIILNGLDVMQDGDPVTLLTDVSDVGRHNRAAEKVLDFGEEMKTGKGSGNGQSNVQALDQLEVGGAIGSKEAKELRQLERWDEKGGKNSVKNSNGDTPNEQDLKDLENAPGSNKKSAEPEVDDLDAPILPEGDPAPSTAPAKAAPVETAPPPAPPPAAPDSELDELDSAPAKKATPSSSSSKTKTPSKSSSSDDSDLDELMDH